MSKTILSLIAVLFICPLMSFERNPKQDIPKERTYTVVIPAKLAQPLFTLISGGSIDDLTVGQAKDLAKIVNGQLLEQSEKYRIEDSLAQSKLKKQASDTATKKK